ncbi:hypothetical protein [Jatrophihabitans sp.]|uniref:hypothetical protein n=1 Tax=Jatrophihabitans sp. TaxID=1932789 RepID=UPI0030C6948F|nr:hypothetical protein [Jatrophihabitans sp.]
MTGMAPAGFGPTKYGIPVVSGSSGPSEMHSVPSMGPDDHDGLLLHPSNPLLAFGVIGAVVFGLMAFSTSVRVGKTTAGLKIGDTK